MYRKSVKLFIGFIILVFAVFGVFLLHSWANSPDLFGRIMMPLVYKGITALPTENSITPTVIDLTPSTPEPTADITPVTPAPTIDSTPITPDPTQPLPPPESVYFPLGEGATDVIPHQLVRTDDDRLYAFVLDPNSSVIRGYWTTSTGFPNNPADFNGSINRALTSLPLSVDVAYGGGTFIHILANLNNGELHHEVFDISSNSFTGGVTLATGNPTVAGDYIGTSGVSGLVDLENKLQVVYWSNGNTISHREYSINPASGSLTLVNGPTRVDDSGSANHPVLAISPLDNSLTVAWISEATNPVRILARTRNSAGEWSDILALSTAPVWHSTNFGINIDQGPSLLVDSNGDKHLTYIENWDETNDYGRIHYVYDDGSGWVDQELSEYSHDPALAITGSGQIAIIGHGHPNNTSCLSMDDMCFMQKQSDGTWDSPKLFASPPAGNSFDSSPSVKWSVVSFNRPDTIEFLFFMTPYGDPTVYYGRLP